MKAQLVVVSSERKLAIVIPLYFWVSLAATKEPHPTQDKSVSDFDVVKLVIGYVVGLYEVSQTQVLKSVSTFGWIQTYFPRIFENG